MTSVRSVYLDNAATTPVDPAVAEAMAPYAATTYGNASSLYALGRQARRAVEQAREDLARLLGVSPEEIVFTSGATEADNLALKGLAFARPERRHVVISAVEHHAVLHPAEWLARRGYEVVRVGVDATGRVDPAEVEAAIRKETLLVSVMAANNEVGTLEPVDRIGAICRAQGVPFPPDAAQAFGKVPLSLAHVDLLSTSAHKLNGPKGVGLLYVRKGLRLDPLFHGGGHEGGRRSGTENTPGIVGLAEAARLSFAAIEDTEARLSRLRRRMIEAVLRLRGTRLNGKEEESLPTIANFSFAGVEGESLVMKLDEQGIAASTGSACSSPDLEPSHVLLAMGVPLPLAHGSLRVSLGRQTTEEDVDIFLAALPRAVEELRAVSPFKGDDLQCTTRR
jgi:cysteine desulfurase